MLSECEKAKRGNQHPGKSSSIMECIKIDGVKIESEITEGRDVWEVVPGREAGWDLQSNINQVHESSLKKPV